MSYTKLEISNGMTGLPVRNCSHQGPNMYNLVQEPENMGLKKWSVKSTFTILDRFGLGGSKWMLSTHNANC